MGNEEKGIYTALVITLFLSIFISLFFLKATYEAPAPFSEIYFPGYKDLPNNLELDRNYTFSTVIRSMEAYPENYDYQVDLELYNIYDTGEGYQDCFYAYREKSFYKWTMSNETGHENMLLKDWGNSSFHDFYAGPEESPLGLGDRHTLYFDYEPAYGRGQFSVIYEQGNGSSYGFTISGSDNLLYFFSEQGGVFSYNETFLNVTENPHTVVIDANAGVLKFYFDKNLSYEGALPDASANNLVFESHNGYYNIRRAKVSDRALMRDILFDEDALSDEKWMILTGKKDIISMRVKSEMEPVKYNTSLSYFLNLSGVGQKKLSGLNLGEVDLTSSIYTEDTSIYPLLFRWAKIPYNISTYPTFEYETEDKNTEINFSDYTIRFDYLPLYGDRQLMTYLYDMNNQTRYGFFISEKYRSIFLLDFSNDKIRLTMRDITLPYRKHKVSMNFTGSNMAIFLDGVMLFNVTNASNQFSDLSFEAKNSYVQIENLAVTKDNVTCSSLTVYEKCTKDYRVAGPRYNLNKLIPVDTFTSDWVTGNLTGAEIGVGIPFAPLAAPLAIRRVIGSMAPGAEEVNPYIKDKVYSFNGPNAVISGLYNYSFGYDYTNLDGNMITSASFADLNGTEKIRLVLADLNNTAYLFQDDMNQTYRINLSDRSRHRIEFRFDNGRLGIYMDYNKLLFAENNVNMSDGYFVLSTQNTYANFDNVNLMNNEEQSLRRFDLQENPCQLRRIYYQVLNESTAALAPGENLTVESGFSVSQDFDFGLVSAKLINKNQSIHFWLKR